MLFLDLFFASLTTLCDIALPMIMRRLTNSALGVVEAMGLGALLRMSLLYIVYVGSAVYGYYHWKKHGKILADAV